jgi:hypothetical protein
MNDIPSAVFRQVAEGWLARFESLEEACQVLEVNGRVSASGWRKRLIDSTYAGRVRLDGTPGTRQLSWFARPSLTGHEVDEFLVAADAVEMWHLPPLDAYAPKRPQIFCHDCGKPIKPGDCRPLDLFRHVPDAPGGVVWDRTKQQWARRPRNARRGGRRFRWYDLCRRCAGEALRLRSANGGSVTEHGVKRSLRARDRIPPKRGGRPRLLTDDQLRQAHAVYELHGLSRRQIARRMIDAGYEGSLQGLEQAMLYGWRRLGLPARPRGVAMAMARFGTDGTKSRRHKVRCSARLTRGEGRCRQYVRRVVTATGSHPAEDGLCWNHANPRKEVMQQPR